MKTTHDMTTQDHDQLEGPAIAGEIEAQNRVVHTDVLRAFWSKY